MSLEEDDLLYKVISTEKYEKTHKKKINEIKKDHTIQIEEIRTMHIVVKGEIVWQSRILYKNKKI